MDFPLFQVFDCGAYRFGVQKISRVYLNQHVPLQHPVYKVLVPEVLHKPVHMGNHRLAAQILPQADDLIQHGIGPGCHRGLHQNGAAAADGQPFHPIGLADAGKIQHLRPQHDEREGLRLQRHGIPEPQKGLIAAGHKAFGVLLVGIEMAGRHHDPHALPVAFPQQGQTFRRAGSAVIHVREDMTVVIDHRHTPKGSSVYNRQRTGTRPVLSVFDQACSKQAHFLKSPKGHGPPLFQAAVFYAW